MKFFRMLGRSIRDAFKSVFRNFSLSLASISCTTITLLIVAVSVLASLNVENFTKLIEDDVTIQVFVKETATKEDTDKMEEEIKALSNIASVDFVSKIDAKETVKKMDETLDALLSEWDENESPLMDNFQVKVTDIEKIEETANQIKALDNIYNVSYGKEMVNNLVALFNTIENIAYIVVIALIIVTVFLIVNTIKLTIFSRKREISIMRLVGSSNISIKMPFVIEGMVLGLIGSIIPVLAILFGYTALYQTSGGFVYSHLITLISPEPFIYFVSLGIVGIGILIGMIGSASAVGKYLKI